MSKYNPDDFDDQDLVAALKEEQKFTSSNKEHHDVKLEKEGETWHIRFLPVRFGSRNLFFARIPQHWVNKRPYFCEKNAPEDFGGNPNAHCDLCDLSAELNESSIKDVATLGYKAGASNQWLTYCLVWSKKSPGHDLWEPEGDEVWTPYKFWLNKTIFEELREYWLRQKEKRPNIKDSILCPENGFDFYIKRSNNKLVLQKDDPRPIYPDGYSQEEKMDLMNFIMGKIKAPNYRPLSAEEMEAAKIKLEDAARKLEVGGSSRGKTQSRGSGDSDDVDLPQRPASRFGSRSQQAPPARRQPVEEEAPRPTRSSAPPASPRSVPSARPPAHRPPARPVQDEDDIPYDSAGQNATEDDQAMQEAQPEPQPSPSDRLRQAPRPPAPRSAPRAEAPAQTKPSSSVDDDDDVTDESHDPVPSSGLEEEEAPPTPVTRVQQPQAPAPSAPPRPTSKMSERLRGAIQRTQQ